MSLQDLASIRRLVAQGVPQRQVARDLGAAARATVEVRVRALLAEHFGSAGDGERRAGRVDGVDHVVA